MSSYILKNGKIFKEKNPQSKDKVKENVSQNKNKVDTIVKNTITKHNGQSNNNKKLYPINGFKNKLKEIKHQINQANKINHFKNRWIEIMTQIEAFNGYHQTYSLMNVKITNYGYACNIFIQDGFSREMLESNIKIIEDNLGCTLLLKKCKRKTYFEAKFITKDIKIPNFSPIKLKPYESFCGYTHEGTPLIIDRNKHAHMLLTGLTGNGKSKFLDCLIVTLVCSCSSKDMEFYFIQVAKSDLRIYKNLEHCRGYASTLEETLKILIKIQNEMQKRDKIIGELHEHGICDSIKTYNSLYPNNKMPYIYVVFDEMSSIIDSSGDSENIKKMKSEISKYVDAIAQYGRSLGVFGNFCTQRATANKLPSFTKSQSELKISFKQNNKKSAEVALDNPDLALDLDSREAIVYTDDYYYIKTPYITDKMTFNYIKPYLNFNKWKNKNNTAKNNFAKDNKPKQNRKRINNNIEQLKVNTKNIENKNNKKNINNNKINKLEQGKFIDFKKVTPPKTKKDLILNNIKNIPGYVPYKPPKKGE